MNFNQIRTRTEKILFPVAVIFSLAVWIGLASGPYLWVKNQPKKESIPCIYLNEETKQYNYIAIEKNKAEDKEYQEDCLKKEEIPAEIYEEAAAKVAAENQQEQDPKQMAGIYGVIVTYAGMLLGFIYVSAALSMAHIRLNGVRISKTQFPAFYKIYEKTAQELGLKKVPNAYIIHAAGELNAFAIKISRRRMVVFFTELIQELVEKNNFDELSAVAAHELTHVRLKHINYWIFLMPFYLLPFIGKILVRSREYSADRGAFFICKNKEVVHRALAKLAAGKLVGGEIDLQEYMEQPKTEPGFFTWIARIMASHPPIPYRIKAIEKLK